MRPGFPIPALLLAVSLTGFCQQPVLETRPADPQTEPRYSALIDRMLVLQAQIDHTMDLDTLKALQRELDAVNEKITQANMAAIRQHTAELDALVPQMMQAMQGKRRHWWRIK